MNHAIPLLWLCGPAGVGKSTVSWQLYTELASTGVRVAFADGDQLCMCYPPPPDDPGRQRVKALNAGSMLPNFRAAGAQCVIINGVLDQPGLASELLPGAEVTVCRLRAREDEVERRFTGRHQQPADMGQLLAQLRDEIRDMDQSSFADACVDTTGVPADEVAALVRAACADWPGFTGHLTDWEGADWEGQYPDQSRPPGSGRVVLITGPTGVGKSTIGFRFYLNCLNAGLTAGYADLRQIGFLRPAAEGDPDCQRLRARNLSAMWRNYQAAGASHLVAVGAIDEQPDLRLYAEELAGADLSLVRLTAGRDELMRRVMTRGDGGSWPEPGDPLRGRSAAYLARVARQVAHDVEALDRSGPGWPGGKAVDTTGRSPDESAGLIADAVGWLDHAGSITPVRSP